MFILYSQQNTNRGKPFFYGIDRMIHFLVKQRYNSIVHSIITTRHNNGRSTMRSQYKRQCNTNKKPLIKLIDDLKTTQLTKKKLSPIIL